MPDASRYQPIVLDHGRAVRRRESEALLDDAPMLQRLVAVA